MLKNLFIAALLVTVSGALVVGILDAQGTADLSETASVQAQAPVPTATATVLAPVTAGSGPVLAQQSVNQVGTAWTGRGSIVALTDFGLTLALVDGTQVTIELGPPTFWQAQGVVLSVGDVISVQGFFNGEQYHAQIVTNASGAQMALRSATGQPLWSGGADQSGTVGAAGALAGAQAGASGVGQVQVAAEDWVSLDGTVTAVNQNGLTIQTAAGEVFTLQFGRADFWQSQAVTFTVGDAVQVRGFWQADQFQTGQVTKLATGERLLLRDPNGRPLWGGPGRTGATGTGTQTGAQPGTQGAGQVGNGAGANTNGNGNGNGRRGNRNR